MRSHPLRGCSAQPMSSANGQTKVRPSAISAVDQIDSTHTASSPTMLFRREERHPFLDQNREATIPRQHATYSLTMYSHGSSARVGVGKRGHGGRDYRPPRNRRDPNAVPPPLKQCSCLCQLDLPEYATTAPTRVHASFGGREAQEALERELRSLFLVHLVVPGRKQAGPVAVVGQTQHQALPAVAYLLQRLASLEQSNNNVITGRIQRRVQDPNDVTLEGYWTLPPLQADDSPVVQLCWIFQCPNQWCVMSCFFHESKGSSDTAPQSSSEDSTADSSSALAAMETLQISIDNFKFRMGSLQGVEIILHDGPMMALGAGSPPRIKALYEEVEQSLAKLQAAQLESMT